MAVASGKQSKRAGANGDGQCQIERLRSARKLRSGLHRASAMPKTATTAPGSKPKVAGGVARAVNTVHRNYRIAIHFETQITPKFL